MAKQADAADAFVQGRTKIASAFSTNGKVAMSYQMTIAFRSKRGVIYYILPPSAGGECRVSQTTSKHMGEVYQAIHRAGVKAVGVKTHDELLKKIAKD